MIILNKISITIIIIIVILIFLRLIAYYITLPQFINLALNIFNINIKVNGVKNLKDYNKENYVIMANHYNAPDYAIIHHTFNSLVKSNKKIYSVAKNTVFGDKIDASTLSYLFGLFRTKMIIFFNLISYKRGDKISGEKVKNKMLTVLKSNNILVFPDGEAIKTGKPKFFKPGTFKLCAENNIKILPLTIIYNRDISVSREDKVNFNNFYNLIATVYIHKPVYNRDWKQLRSVVFNTISKPFNVNNNS